MTHTLITAHAGSENTKANALAGIAQLLKLGADAVEVDARLGDRGIYLSHDEFKPGAEYDSLEDCFKLAAKVPGACLNVDLKHEGLARMVADMARQTGVEGRYIFTGSVADDEISFLKQSGATVWYNAQLLSESERKDPLGAVREKGFEVLNTHYSWISEDMLRDAPMRLSLWTVDDEQTLIKYLKAGVLNITTRRPLLALKLRKTIQG